MPDSPYRQTAIYLDDDDGCGFYTIRVQLASFISKDTAGKIAKKIGKFVGRIVDQGGKMRSTLRKCQPPDAASEVDL